MSTASVVRSRSALWLVPLALFGCGLTRNPMQGDEGGAGESQSSGGRGVDTNGGESGEEGGSGGRGGAGKGGSKAIAGNAGANAGGASGGKGSQGTGGAVSGGGASGSAGGGSKGGAANAGAGGTGTSAGAGGSGGAGGSAGAGGSGGAAGSANAGGAGVSGGAGGSVSAGAGSGGKANTAGSGGKAGSGGNQPGPCSTPEATRPTLRDWAVEVLTGEDSGSGLVRRFASSVTVSLVSGDGPNNVMVGNVARALDRAIADSGIRVTQVTSSDETADMLVFCTNFAAFEFIAEEYSFSADSAGAAQTHVTSNSSRTLQRAFILLATDQLNTEQLTHAAHEEMTQALGPLANSSRVRESVLYADGSDGGAASSLHCYDQELLRLLYVHLAPGDDAADVTNAFDRAWDIR